MATLNLAFRGLYGYVIHGNSFTNEKRLVYRTGFNGFGFVRELKLAQCPEPVQRAVAPMPFESDPAVSTQEQFTASQFATEHGAESSLPVTPKSQLRLL